METIDKIPHQPKKKINDFVWVGIGMVALIAVLVLLKYVMHQFQLI